MLSIHPNVLNAHAINIVTKVRPLNTKEEDRVQFFMWLDNWIGAGTTPELRKEAACIAIEQLGGLDNTVVANNEVALQGSYYGRKRTGGSINIVQKVIDGVATQEQVIDLFNSIVALLICDHARDDVRKILRNNLELEVLTNLPDLFSGKQSDWAVKPEFHDLAGWMVEQAA